MRTAIFLGLILVASAIEAQGNKVIILENTMMLLATFAVVFFAIDIIELINKLRNRK